MTEERNVVRGGSVAVEILQAYRHWAHIDTQVFEFAEEVEEVVRRQGELRRFEIVGGKG